MRDSLFHLTELILWREPSASPKKKMTILHEMKGNEGSLQSSILDAPYM